MPRAQPRMGRAQARVGGRAGRQSTGRVHPGQQRTGCGSGGKGPTAGRNGRRPIHPTPPRVEAALCARGGGGFVVRARSLRRRLPPTRQRARAW
eukprot:6385495-Prymnesium_polylepis.1